MACIRVPDQDREIKDPAEIAEFLRPHGIFYEHWEVEGRLPDDPTDEQILQSYAPEIQRLKTRGGYVTADVINVGRDTPNLEAMLNKFNKEHTHDEDEVRFTVSGRGLFHIHPEMGSVFSIQVESGDLINVPRGTRHWFDLCRDRQIRCIRLFQDPAGWTPHYVDGAVHEKYTPVCLGPDYLPPREKIDPVVEI